MSAGLQVEKIDKAQDVKAIQSTSGRSVDSERSQGGLLRVGNGPYQAPESASGESESIRTSTHAPERTRGSQFLWIPFVKENSEDVGAKTLGFPKLVADQASESISFGIEKTDSITQAQTIQETSATPSGDSPG
jgi:hypothetical protein